MDQNSRLRRRFGRFLGWQRLLGRAGNAHAHEHELQPFAQRVNHTHPAIRSCNRLSLRYLPGGTVSTGVAGELSPLRIATAAGGRGLAALASKMLTCHIRPFCRSRIRPHRPLPPAQSPRARAGTSALRGPWVNAPARELSGEREANRWCGTVVAGHPGRWIATRAKERIHARQKGKTTCLTFCSIQLSPYWRWVLPRH